MFGNLQLFMNVHRFKKSYVLISRILFFTAAIAIGFSSKAQLCNGSFGDPVVNISFGMGAGDAGFTPPAGYIYTSSDCPNDGFYTITTSSPACFGNSWHVVNADHTGNGAFLLVNASHQPSDFFLTTVTGLCPNTTYEFSSWMMNMVNFTPSIEPNVTFTIETASGTILNSFNTGNIPVSSQPLWQQYGFNFTTTAGLTSVVLRMKNNAPGGTGNDLALDDISFRPCGPQLTSTVAGHPNTFDVCRDNQLIYSLIGSASPGLTDPVYQWQLSLDSGTTWTDIPGATGLLYNRQASVPGNYRYRLTTAERGNSSISSCRISSNLVIINVEAPPVISAGPDRVILTGKSTVLQASSPDASTTYTWSPPDYLSAVNELNPVSAALQDILYTITAISNSGCENTDQVMVKVVNGIFVPTAFTPNNDGKNDNWRIPFLDPGWGCTVRVFNRLGQQVYQTNGLVNWDGKLGGILQPPGTYVYMIEFPDNTPGMKGTVQLIR